MLRCFALLFLRICVCLMLFGVLIAREWGWSEYAAPELYLIHWQQVGPRGEWRIISASDGANTSLAMDTGRILALDCSPDGQSLAVLDNQHLLRVMTAAGVSDDHAIDPAYDALTVANDGRVTLYDPALGGLRVGAQNARETFSAPPDASGNYHVAGGADGWQLWNSELNLVQLVTPSGELIRTILPVSGGRWLASAYGRHTARTSINARATTDSTPWASSAACSQ